MWPQSPRHGAVKQVACTHRTACTTSALHRHPPLSHRTIKHVFLRSPSVGGRRRRRQGGPHCTSCAPKQRVHSVQTCFTLRCSYRGGGNQENWNGQISCGENLAPILKYRCKTWHKSPDCGTRTNVDREWWLLFPAGLWLVAVVSSSGRLLGWLPLLPGGCTTETGMPGALKMASDLQTPRHNLAHVCCAKLCHSNRTGS